MNVIPQCIVKRDGTLAPFDQARIAVAIEKAQSALGRADVALAAEMARVVTERLSHGADGGHPSVEAVQDAVIWVLQESGDYEVALAYSRYRDARERERRARLTRQESSADDERLNLAIVDRRGLRRSWDPVKLERDLMTQENLSPKVASDVRISIERMLAKTDATECSASLLAHLIPAALVECGLASVAERHAPIALPRHLVASAAETVQAPQYLGGLLLRAFSLSNTLPPQSAHLYERGRLWIEGLDTPVLGSQMLAVIDGGRDVWRILAEASAVAISARLSWREVSLVLPPVVLGQLESDPEPFLPTLSALCKLATVHLFCDGRSPLIARWPQICPHLGIATYAQDFILQAELAEAKVPSISGPHLAQPGFRRYTNVRMALNAQGLEESFSELDLLAMGLIAGALARRSTLAPHPDRERGLYRYAIFGLGPGSASSVYLDRQIQQESLRRGITLERSSDLPEEACVHLARLLEE